MPNLNAQEWLYELFAFEWCPECGRDHRHHSVVDTPIGHAFAKCDRPALLDENGFPIMNPEGYGDEPAARGLDL